MNFPQELAPDLDKECQFLWDEKKITDGNREVAVSRLQDRDGSAVASYVRMRWANEGREQPYPWAEVKKEANGLIRKAVEDWQPTSRRTHLVQD